MSSPLHRIPWGIWYSLLAALAWGSAGCITPYDPTQPAVAEEREDQRLLNEQIRRLQGDTESAMMQLNDLRQEIERSHRQTTSVLDARLDAVSRDVAALQSRLAALEQGREADKQEIIDRLSQKIASLISQSQASASGAGMRRSTQRASEYGYEHTVESGQTLSAIAQAYGVSTRAIIEANKLRNPDQLQVGQTLFIPE